MMLLIPPSSPTRRLLALALATSCIGIAQVHGETSDSTANETNELVEEIVTVGTRTQARSTLESTVPVQLFDQEEIESVAMATDLTDIVQRLVPSFNVSREPISDGASFMRPPFVRGLDSDKVLVLVNGKRRHKGALVRLGGSGTHGADISSIPVSALSSLEVLQDGASALYGSDAIAGVINFKLKENSDATTFSATVGEYTQGGGDIRLSSNVGLPFLQGFLSLSAEYSDTRGTSRGKRYDLAVGGGSGLTPAQSAEVAVDTDGDGRLDRFGPDSLTEIRDSIGNLISLVWGADGIPDDTTPKYKENLANPEQIWGEPAREDAKLSMNFGIPLTTELLGQTELYGFGNWRDSESTGSFFYRRPGVGQLNPVRLADGSIYNPRDRFPGGFTPKFTGNINDISLIAGLRGENPQQLSWDVSLRYGSSQMSYDLNNTWNPSMGPSSPTSFKPGVLRSTDVSLNADFEWTLTAAWTSPVFMAFGYEYRRDGYEIQAGDSASHMVGPFARRDPFNFDITMEEANADPNDALEGPECRLAGHAELIANDPDISAQPGGNCIAGDPIYNVMSVGSNGFPGYDPRYSVDKTRGISAIYIELSSDFSPKWTGDLAGRLEAAGPCGYVATTKFATRYELSDYAAVRSSIGTGFRAATIGQISTVNVSTRINAQGNPVAEGIFPTNHPVASYFGAKPLDPERSRHITAGLVVSKPLSDYWSLGNSPRSPISQTPSSISPIQSIDWSVTVDGYIVDLEDRLTLSSPFRVDEQAVADLVAQGVTEANSIAQVIYFTNALETRSMGMDVVGTLNFRSKYGATEISGTLNWNKIEITDQAPQIRSDGSTFLLINAEGLYDFEHTWPRYRGVITANHFFQNGITVMLRANRFGTHKNASNSSLETIQTFSSKWQWDASLRFQPWQHYQVTASMINIFDAVPDTAQFEACCGRIVRSDSLVPWQGPYYSLTITYNKD